MNNQKLMMFAVAGLLAPLANAAADNGLKSPTTTMVIPHPTADKAPVTGGTQPRLRRTNEEQPGNEMATWALFADGKTGLYFSMATELPATTAGGPVRGATHRMQLALVPFSLAQGADGAVAVTADASKGRFVTQNIGDEYRNANVPAAFAIDGGKAICAQYNYQANNTNDTKLYVQCFDQAGAVVMPQTEAFAKNNDDVCGSIENNRPSFIDKVGGKERYISWCLANGNGSDNAWARVFSITSNGANYSFKREYDLTILNQEERSRGMCSVDPGATFAVCAGTEGNNQPQREGTWLAAVDLTPGKYNGPNQQAALLWKKQIGGRTTIDGRRTYSMRAMISRVTTTDAQGNIVPTDMLFWRDGRLEGNNNGNNGKGGTYRANMFAVMKVTREGMQYVTPLTDLSTTELFGVDGTHNIQASVLVGEGDKLKPALLIQNGSHTGGQGTAQMRALGWDQASSKFTTLGQFGTGPSDRHLYPNYLGNNPGNQGRNHAHGSMIVNPFFGQNGNNDKLLFVVASTGKGTNMDPATKLAAYISVMPIASGAKPAQAPAGQPGTGGTSGGTTDEGTTDDGSDTTLGGCSAGGSAGLASFLLIGLAAFIRRRR
jgi:hypothetical protein